jgi:hypothetical protein
MKKLSILIAFIGSLHAASAQHYGGFTFTPYAVENYNSWRSASYQGPEVTDIKTTFGFAVGYQGLLMPERRFSFSYGLLYAYGYNETRYEGPPYQYGTMAQRIDMESLQLPLWWRYNILKNKKWQPFIAVSTTVNYALVSDRTFTYDDRPPSSTVINNGFFLSPELAVGVNYITDKWMFTLQPTLGAAYARQLGLGFSVLKKF